MDVPPWSMLVHNAPCFSAAMIFWKLPSEATALQSPVMGEACWYQETLPRKREGRRQ